MDSPMLVRLGALVFIVVAVTAAVVEMNRAEQRPSFKAVRVVEPAHDPLREEQRRCQQLGEAAAADPKCLGVWAQTRDRFLGRAATPDEGR
ncbi:MAG: conjugal transfer protein TrbK [Rhizobiales bacterium 32-66-8]|nr:MAG: conjugal transfer protein TrbK [Rhizobiales bacterium 32-66-8]